MAAMVIAQYPQGSHVTCVARLKVIKSRAAVKVREANARVRAGSSGAGRWGQPGGAYHLGAIGIAWRPPPADRAPQGNSDPPARSLVSPAHDGNLPQRRSAAGSGGRC